MIFNTETPWSLGGFAGTIFAAQKLPIFEGVSMSSNLQYFSGKLSVTVLSSMVNNDQ